MSPSTRHRAPEPSAVFAALGDSTRLAIVRRLSAESFLSVTALTEGFTLRWNVDPDEVPTDLEGVPRLFEDDDDPDEPAWDLYSACVYFLAACMTEAGDGAGEGA